MAVTADICLRPSTICCQLVRTVTFGSGEMVTCGELPAARPAGSSAG